MALVNASVRAQVNFKVSKDYGLGTDEKDVSLDLLRNLSLGTIADACDRIRAGRLLLTSGAAQDLDLNSAAATDPRGDIAQMAKVVAVIAFNDDTTAANIVNVGGGGAGYFNAWANANTEKQKLDPKGMLLRYCPTTAAWACGSGSNLLKFEAVAGTNVPVRYVILGRSA